VLLPPVSALTEMVATAYADAVRCGASIQLAVDVLEPLRADFVQAGELYRLDDAFSGAIARVATDGLLPVVSRLRAGYREAVAARVRSVVLDACAEGYVPGRQLWRRLLAEAIGELSLPIMEALTAPGWLPAELEGDRTRYAVGIRHARRSEWLATRGLVDELLDEAALAPLERALLLAVRAEIAWYFTDDLRAGFRDAREVTELAPRTPRAAEVEVESLLLSGRPEDAEEAVRRALVEHPRHGGLHRASYSCAVALSLGTDETEKRLLAALREAPYHSDLYLRLILVLGDRGDDRDTRIPLLLAQADAVEPQNTYDHRLVLASALHKAGAAARAVGVLEECGRSEPDRLPAHVTLARMLGDGDLAAASHAVERALALDPDDVEALTVAASILESQGDVTRAVERCRHAVQQPVKRALALVTLARCEQTAGDELAAQQHAAAALAANPWDEDILDEVAEVARGVWQREGYAAAKHVLEPPADAPAAPIHLRLGRLASDLGDTSVAVEELSRAVRLAPPRAAWHRELARALWGAHQWDQSAAALDRALALDADEGAYADGLAAVHNAHGNAVFESGDYASAVPLYARAVELADTDAVLHYNLASALDYSAVPGRLLEHLTRAVAELSRSVELAPENVSYEVYRTTLAAKAERIRRFGELIVTPAAQLSLAVEVADDLVPSVDPGQGGGRLFDEEIPRLRSVLEADLGFPVPGIRVRGSTLPAGGVRVLLEGVVVSSARVPAGADCVLAPPAVLVERGAALEPLTQSNDPAGAGVCTWVPAAVLDPLDLSGLHRLTTTQYILRLVEDVVRRRPATFFDLGTALAWVSDHAERDGDSGDQAVSPLRLAVARTLRSLVQDGIRLDPAVVPVVEEAASAALRDGDPAVVVVPDVVARTRLAIAPSLPGHGRPGVLHLPREISERIATLGYLGPEEANGVAIAARAQSSKDLVLVVEHPTARGYVQRLVADELGVRIGTDLAVLTAAEALAGARAMKRSGS
jgi:tetratricopeptide (TPR) repeat protein